MFKNIISSLFLCVVAVLLSSCLTRPIDTKIGGSIKNFQKVAHNIQLGQSKQHVLSIIRQAQSNLGQYGKSPTAFMKDGKRIEIYYARSGWVADGLTTDDEYTPYIFVDDVLAEIGWQALGGAKTRGDAAAAAALRKSNIAASNALMKYGLDMAKQPRTTYQKRQTCNTINIGTAMFPNWQTRCY
jgi:hypothetical protein